MIKRAVLQKNNPLQNDLLNKFNYIVNYGSSNIRGLKVRSHGKEPVEVGWQKNANYEVNSYEILSWINAGGNYGITSPSGFECSIDADEIEIQEELESNLPVTCRWSTGKEGHIQFIYYMKDSPIGCIPLKDGSYVKGKGGYAIAPGSIHPNGIIYGSRELRNVPVAVIRKEELMKVIRPFIVGKESNLSKDPVFINKGKGDILAVMNRFNVNMAEFRLTGSWLRGPHPVHGSGTGSNFVINPSTDTWHCFRHGTGGGIISLIAVLERLVDCKDLRGEK